MWPAAIEQHKEAAVLMTGSSDREQTVLKHQKGFPTIYSDQIGPSPKTLKPRQKNKVTYWRESTTLASEILFLIHTFHKQKPSNTTHNSITKLFQFYPHSLTIYTIFPQQKCNPRHLDKKSLGQEYIFELVLTMPIHYVFFQLPGVIMKSKDIEMSWVRQHPIKGTKTLNRSAFSSSPPKQPTETAQELQPGDQRGEATQRSRPGHRRTNCTWGVGLRGQNTKFQQISLHGLLSYASAC